MPLYVSCSISFSSAWYHHHAGSRYTEDILGDPVARYEQSKREWECRINKYPEFFEREKDSPPRPYLGIGVPTNPKIFGCKVKFREHMDAHALPLLKPDDDPKSLKLPDVQEGMNWVYEEIDTLLDAGWKRKELGLPDLQGPLNTSMKLVGDQRMLRLIASKKRAGDVRHVLEVASDLYIEVHQSLRKATERAVDGGFTASGCTYFYISPKHFENFIIPIVKKCEVLGEAGLHHCGEAPTEKIEAYAKYPWRNVTFGFGSDLKLARKLMIHPKLGPIQFGCRISPFRMLNQPAEQITKDVEWILENVKGGPAGIHLVGCPNGTPEENLWALWNAVKAYNDKKAEEEEEE